MKRTTYLSLYAVAFLLSFPACQKEKEKGPLFPFPDGIQWGYINNKGRKVIPAQFENALEFSEGLAAVKRNGKWGYINDQGVEVIPAIHAGAGPFLQGLAIVNSGLATKPFGVIDASGRWKIPPSFRVLERSKENDAFFKGQREASEVYAVYDREGMVAEGPLPLKIHLLNPTSPEVAVPVAQVDSASRKIGYVDGMGKWVIKPEWDDAEPFKNGLARVGDWRSNTMAYIDTRGKIIWKGSLP
jgi:hypothetical protein